MIYFYVIVANMNLQIYLLSMRYYLRVLELPGQNEAAVTGREEDWEGNSASTSAGISSRKSYSGRGRSSKRGRGQIGTSQYFKSRYKGGKKKRYVKAAKELY